MYLFEVKKLQKRNRYKENKVSCTVKNNINNKIR